MVLNSKDNSFIITESYIKDHLPEVMLGAIIVPSHFYLKYSKRRVS